MKYRDDFEGLDLRDKIPATLTNKVILMFGESWCHNDRDDGSFSLNSYSLGERILDDSTDPNKNFRMAIGAMNLSYLEDTRDPEDYCCDKDLPLFKEVIESLPKDWDAHSMIDLHWVFLKRGKQENPELFEFVDKWLQEETYGSTD